MNQIAERYVKLVLAVGQHDKNFVDAYYGDAAWKPTGAPVGLEEARQTRAPPFATNFGRIKIDEAGDDLQTLRHAYLNKQLAAVEARLAMLMGEKLSFDDEATRLYDATPPKKTEADFQPVLDELDKLLPGKGTLIDRYAAFRSRYVIPTAKLDAVFRAAIDECRARTMAHLTLPAGETFTVEYVKGQPWSAYNWYKGNFTSVIQVNTDFPITIDRAIDLACHEGYPGHHVYNALLEKHLVRDRGWVEFSVYPLFSPQSLIAEGTANFGIEVAFPSEIADGVRAREAVSAGRTRSEDGRDVRGGAGCDCEAELRRQRSGQTIPERRDRSRGRGGLAAEIRDDAGRPRRTAHALLRHLPELRHQLQPGTGSCARVHRKSTAARWTIPTCAGSCLGN